MSSPVSPTNAQDCMTLAAALLRRGISSPEIQRTVQGIHDFAESQDHCTVNQWNALQNIKGVMDKYDFKMRHRHKPQRKEVCEPPAGRSRASQAWGDVEDDYEAGEMYGWDQYY